MQKRLDQQVRNIPSSFKLNSKFESLLPQDYDCNAQLKSTMDAEEYKTQINGKNVLNHTTLNVTLKELASRQEFELAEAIKRILQNNQIVKPLVHADPYSVSTTYYKVDLPSSDLEKITDIFFELEASHVNGDGEATPTSSFYGSLADKWSMLT